VPSCENATANTPKPICMFISGTVSPIFVYVTEGARENWFFHIWDITEFCGHVINEDMYMCAVDSAAGLAVKYVAKLAASVMS
jgi:hypothetical protein